MLKQAGFIQIIAGILILLVVAGLGVGIYIANHNTNPNPRAGNTQVLQAPSPLAESQAAVTPAPSPIQNAADLKQAQSQLDQTDVDGITKDMSQLDSAANSF